MLTAASAPQLPEVIRVQSPEKSLLGKDDSKSPPRCGPFYAQTAATLRRALNDRTLPNALETDCPHCPQSKTICPQSFWGQIYSMVTTTYKRFCDLPPLPPLFFVDTPKESTPKARQSPHRGWCLRSWGTPLKGTPKEIANAGNSSRVASLVLVAPLGGLYLISSLSQCQHCDRLAYRVQSQHLDRLA